MADASGVTWSATSGLKDRKADLNFEDLHHYQRIVVALAETIRLMGEIDATIDAHGGWPIDRGPVLWGA